MTRGLNVSLSRRPRPSSRQLALIAGSIAVCWVMIIALVAIVVFAAAGVLPARNPTVIEASIVILATEGSIAAAIAIPIWIQRSLPVPLV